MTPPVYTVKPKNIFKHPFNKFDLDKLVNRESQNDDITDYFNYGFNEDTMNIYGKLVKRNIEVLNENINPTYFDAPSELMRLNDEIPMDFGGFCKFFDPSIFMDPEATEEELQHNNDFHNGERLFKNLIAVTFLKKPEYPLIDFVKGMYRNDPTQENWLCDIMDQIQQNLQKRYEDILKKLVQKKNNPGNISTNNQNAENNGHNQSSKPKKQNHSLPWQSKEGKKQEESAGYKMEQSSSKSSEDNDHDSNESDSDSSSSSQRKRSKNRQKSRSRNKKSRHKKTKKNERNRRQYRRNRDRKKSKSSKKKNSKDRSRSRKKNKNRRRRD